MGFEELRQCLSLPDDVEIVGVAAGSEYGTLCDNALIFKVTGPTCPLVPEGHPIPHVNRGDL